MFHVVYMSTATAPFTAEAESEVLESARAFNTEHGVTGLLVHAAGFFLQVLEGEQDAVEAAYARAAASDRHTALLRTPALEVPERVFPDWAMGFAAAAPGHVAAQLLQRLVDHQLITAEQVRAVLLERFSETVAA